MDLFLTVTKLNALLLRKGQYYLNKDAFNKTTETYGTYEISDLNFFYGDVPTEEYDPVAAAMGNNNK